MQDKIALYRNSINNFIKENIEKQSLITKKHELINNNHILSIIALTLINSLNRKNKRTAHGYNIAFAISLLDIYKGEPHLLCCIIKFLDENLLLLAKQVNTISNNNTNDQQLTLDKIITINCLSHDILSKLLINLTEGKERCIALAKLTILISWITGCGLLNKEILFDLDIAGNNLGNLIYISNNFNKNNYNQEFDMFVQYKQKYIEIMITYDIFSDTMKNIINMYEENIDKIVAN